MKRFAFLLMSVLFAGLVMAAHPPGVQYDNQEVISFEQLAIEPIAIVAEAVQPVVLTGVVTYNAESLEVTELKYPKSDWYVTTNDAYLYQTWAIRTKLCDYNALCPELQSLRPSWKQADIHLPRLIKHEDLTRLEIGELYKSWMTSET